MAHASQVDLAACGEFKPHPAHEAALRELPHHIQVRMNRSGLNRCLNCWLFRRDHKKHADAKVKGWLHKKWHPEDNEISMGHFSLVALDRLDRFKIPSDNHSDVFEIGSILYDEFSKKDDIPVPSHRLIPPKDREAFVECFEAFYKRLFNDAQMKVLFAIDETGFGRDLGYREHGRRLGLFCLWRICGDKEYMNYRCRATAKCPYQMDVYHKLGPSHGGAKKAGGIKIGERSAFTITQSRRWLGHQWCAFRENASEDLCKAVVSWLASLIDLYGPFCDDSLMDEKEALRRAKEWSRAMAEEEAAIPSATTLRCPFSGATEFPRAAAAVAQTPPLPIPADEDYELQRALRESALAAGPAESETQVPRVPALPPIHAQLHRANTTRAVCKFGPNCYRRNPEHFEEFAHPWLD